MKNRRSIGCGKSIWKQNQHRIHWKSDDLHISTVHLLVERAFRDHGGILSVWWHDRCLEKWNKAKREMIASCRRSCTLTNEDFPFLRICLCHFVSWTKFAVANAAENKNDQAWTRTNETFAVMHPTTEFAWTKQSLFLEWSAQQVEESFTFEQSN